jgi:hypothetical protein
VNDPRTKDKLEKVPSGREHHKTQGLTRKRQTTNEKSKQKLNTPPTFLNASSPLFGRIYHVFHELVLTTQLAIEIYNFVHILSPFGSELIKHILRDASAMHEIKIRVLHRLYIKYLKQLYSTRC